jgi:hypothetical protein
MIGRRARFHAGSGWLERLEPTAYADILSAQFALGGLR